VRRGLHSSSGEARLWTLTVRGIEIHRCVLRDPGSIVAPHMRHVPAA
jgi:hypothetical protein